MSHFYIEGDKINPILASHAHVGFTSEERKEHPTRIKIRFNRKKRRV